MKRLGLICLALVINVSIAQGGFIGGGVTLFTAPGVEGGFVLPIVSIHGGSEVADNLILRGSFDSLLIASLISVDVLYNLPVDSSTVYIGAGPDVLIAILFDAGGVAFGGHGTFGTEFRQNEQLGIYLEGQPGIMLPPEAAGESLFYIKVRAGLNYHF